MRPCTAHKLVENSLRKHEMLQEFPSQHLLEQSQLTAQGTQLQGAHRSTHLFAHQAATSVAAVLPRRTEQRATRELAELQTLALVRQLDQLLAGIRLVLLLLGLSGFNQLRDLEASNCEEFLSRRG